MSLVSPQYAQERSTHMSLVAPASSPGQSNRLPIAVILGISAAGLFIGVFMSVTVVLCIRLRKKRSVRAVPAMELKEIRINGVDSSVILSDADFTNKELHKDINSVGGEKSLHPGITKYSYKELQRSTNNFTTFVGSGAFGSVYKATLHSSGTTLAVKVLSSKSRQGEREFRTEVSLLARLHHRNLVNLLGYCTERRQRILVYEYMSNGSLEKVLYDDQREPLSWTQRVQIIKDIARGIEYLHDGAVPPVIHRDIKSANILLDSSMTARVADFGLSKEVTTVVPTSGIKGTYGYTDPEYIFSRIFTDKSDVYSFGVLVFELLSGRHPQQGLLDYVQMASMGLDEDGDWSELLDSRLNGNCNLVELAMVASLAQRCIRKTPDRRPRMRDVVQSLSRIGTRKNSIMDGLL